jgi:hypothetical protein
LDKVPGIDTLSQDLRDDETGRLDAKKMGALFQVSVRAIAKAAGITRQALDENPDSEKAQPVLKLFAERFAELAHTFFCDYLINLLDTNETFFYHT